MTHYHASEEWHSLLCTLLGAPEIDAINTAGGNGRKSKEIIGFQTQISMTHCVVNNQGRNLNYPFMCAEAHMILTGDNRVSSIQPYCKKITEYSDDGIIFAGAYGPPIDEQIEYVVGKLTQDNMTRQAVLTTWRPNPQPSKDIPCTLSLHFIIRKNRLHIVANMRSSDAWLGWPYDVFNFSMLGAYIVLYFRQIPKYAEMELGELYMQIGSQHLYESHYEKAEQVTDNNHAPDYRPLNLDEFTCANDLLNHLAMLKDRKFSETTRGFMKDVMV